MVAVKFCAECNEDHMAKFITREAETMAMVHHENFVKFYGIEKFQGSDRMRHAILMEYCADGNLQQKMDLNPNGLQRDEFFRVATHLVSGVDYLNRKRITHRDLKPDNVMVSMCSDGLPVYKIGDFGSARQIHVNVWHVRVLTC